MGWEAYFETLFERIDRKVLDADKKKYQGRLTSMRDCSLETLIGHVS